MISFDEAANLMSIVYDAMERMNREERNSFVGLLKKARVSMDVTYPLGKQPKATDDLIKPAGGIIVPGGSNV